MTKRQGLVGSFLPFSEMNICCFRLLVLKGIYHYRVFFVVFRWLKQMEASKASFWGLRKSLAHLHAMHEADSARTRIRVSSSLMARRHGCDDGGEYFVRESVVIVVAWDFP